MSPFPFFDCVSLIYYVCVFCFVVTGGNHIPSSSTSRIIRYVQWWEANLSFLHASQKVWITLVNRHMYAYVRWSPSCCMHWNGLFRQFEFSAWPLDQLLFWVDFVLIQLSPGLIMKFEGKSPQRSMREISGWFRREIWSINGELEGNLRVSSEVGGKSPDVREGNLQ